MKGLFTQGVAVLFSEPPSLAQLRLLLEDYEIVSENPLGTNQWQMESASFRIACRPEVDGYCLLDVVVRSWPDHLGNSDREPALNAAWSLGHFGPFATSGSLARAIEHAHRWEHAAQLAPQHTAFVRMRISYTPSASGPPAPLPDDYDALPELEWLVTLANHVCRHPRALAFFNPNGEVLLPPEMLASVIEDAKTKEAPPLDSMVNVRLAHVEGWQLVDTIGMAQLDLPDQEIVCPEGVSSSEELSAFLFDAAYHMVTTEIPIATDNSTFGPGGTEWVATTRVSAIREPARTTVHWTEIEGPEEPHEFYNDPVVDYSAVPEDEQAQQEPYSPIDDPAMWVVAQPPPLQRGGQYRALGAEGKHRKHGCLWALVVVLVIFTSAAAFIWPTLVSLYRKVIPAPVTQAPAKTTWDEQVEEVLKNWQPNADIDSKAQIVPPASYHTLFGEGRAGSGFLMRYGGSQIVCGVTTLHQFEGKTPASLDGPVGLKVLIDNINVLKLHDVQVQQVTDVNRSFECLEYDPAFTLIPGDELIIPKGDGESIKGKLENSLMIVDKFISSPGRSQEFRVKLAQPFEFKGYSGSPVVKASTGKVVGVLRSGDESKTIIGFETLSLGMPPISPSLNGEGK